MRTRVLIADDHETVREGLRDLLDRHPHLEVVAEAANGVEAVELARKLAPDVVVMDVALPGVNGIDATRQILADTEVVKVVGLSVHSDRFFVEAMLDAGASGYVVKGSAFRDLIEAIEAAVAGGFFVSSALRGVTAVECGDPHPAGSAPGARIAVSIRRRRFRVIFALDEPAATEVLLLGSFGNWEERPHRMTEDGPGRWRASLWLPPGAHEYRFLVDGEWRNATEGDLVHNPYRGFNCLLRIA